MVPEQTGRLKYSHFLIFKHARTLPFRTDRIISSREQKSENKNSATRQCLFL